MPQDTVKGRTPALWFALPAAMVSLGIAGLWRGGAWVWLGIAQLPVLALIDTLLGPDTRPRAALSAFLADLLLVLQLPLVMALWAVFAWRVGPGAAALHGADWLGLVLSTAFVTAYGALPASHELGHRDDALRRRVGNLLDTFLLAPYGVLSHNHVHHLKLDTQVDAETARRGQSLYRFMVYMGWNRHLESWRVEAAPCAGSASRRGRGAAPCGAALRNTRWCWRRSAPLPARAAWRSRRWYRCSRC